MASSSSRKHPSLHGKKRFRPFLEELEARLPPATDLFTVAGNPGDQTPVNFNFVFRNGVFQNEIGVYAVNDALGSVNGLLPDQAGYAQAALTQGQTVVRGGDTVGTPRQLTFAAGTRLAFYLVQNNNRAAVLSSNPQNILGSGALAFFSVDGASPDNFDHVRGVTQGDGGLRLSFEDLTNGGDQDFNDAIVGVGGNGLFLTPGQVGQVVPTTFTWTGRDAAFSNELGLFQVADALGRVNGLLPGSPGYAQAALQNSQVIFQSGQTAGAVQDLNLAAGQRFGFYLVQNGTTREFLQSNPTNNPGAGPIVFFSLFGANPDAVGHFDWQSSTEFGFEDLFGGGDFDLNDIVARLQFGAPTGTPTNDANDGLAPNITARLQTDTFDPARVTPPADTANDLITSDAAITGTVLDNDSVTAFRASIDNANPTINVLDALIADGTFLLDSNRLEAIFDPTNNPNIQLTDGLHTLRLQAVDEFGNTSSVFSFQFTLDRGATATLLLPQASDTGFVGESRTDNAAVTLNGQTEANATVRLVRSTPGVNGPVQVTLATTSANAAGLFTFTNVALNGGPNGLKVFAVDAAGNIGQSGLTLTRNTAPTASAVPTTANVAPNSSTTVNLTPKFSDADNNLPVLRVSTSLGDFLVQLFQNATPQQTANFLNYVNSNDYDNTIFHRSIPGFVIQGGGFQFVNANPNLVDVPTDPAVQNEPGLPNSRGTLALAKVGNDPNSGTNEWFVNLADNVTNLDNQNGGFTVFGQVIGSGQQVYDAIAQVPRFNLGQFQGLPLRNFGGTTLQDATANNFVIINDIAVLADPLTYSVVSVTSNTPGLVVAASIFNSDLVLTHTAGPAGTATVVVRATDRDGTVSGTDHTILVTVA